MMKKSILALSLVSSFTAPAMALSQPGKDIGFPSVEIPKFEIKQVIPSANGTETVIVSNGDTTYAIEDGRIFNEKGEHVGAIKETIEPGLEGDFVIETKHGEVTIDRKGSVKSVKEKPVAKVDGEFSDHDAQPTPDAPTLDEPSIKVGDYRQDIEKANKAYAETNTRIDGLENDFFLFKQETEQRFNKMDDRIDGTNAALHAVTNARPMVANGQTAFGAGVGFAGSAQAVAAGVAHSFEDSGWSASATMNYSNGSYSSDLSAGAGIQYSF